MKRRLVLNENGNPVYVLNEAADCENKPLGEEKHSDFVNRYYDDLVAKGPSKREKEIFAKAKEKYDKEKETPEFKKKQKELADEAHRLYLQQQASMYGEGCSGADCGKKQLEEDCEDIDSCTVGEIKAMGKNDPKFRKIQMMLTDLLMPDDDWGMNDDRLVQVDHIDEPDYPVYDDEAEVEVED